MPWFQWFKELCLVLKVSCKPPPFTSVLEPTGVSFLHPLSPGLLLNSLVPNKPSLALLAPARKLCLALRSRQLQLLSRLAIGGRAQVWKYKILITLKLHRLVRWSQNRSGLADSGSGNTTAPIRTCCLQISARNHRVATRHIGTRVSPPRNSNTRTICSEVCTTPN